MPSFRKTLVGFAVAISTVSAIDHDAVTGYDTKVPDDTAGDLYTKYQPFLKVKSGCVPFPAVDDNGDVGGGLKPSGAMEGGCSESRGQVYVRGKETNDDFAIMYSWYMPKDQNVHGPGNLGHRHEWEAIVVWVDSKSDDADVKAVSYSGHGGYTSKSKDDVDFDGDHPLIAYLTKGGNHELDITSEHGGDQPLIAWDSMSDEARDALNSYDFGDANCPFKDDKFDDNLEKAKP